MIHKNRSNRRRVRKRTIDRKLRVLEDQHRAEGYVPGALGKGKIHCSCGLCSEKSRAFTTNRHRYTTNSRAFLSRRDLRGLIKEEQELKMI